MVEREEPERAPKREHASVDPNDADRQDDHAGGIGEPGKAPEPPIAGEGAELIDNHDSDSAADAAAGSNTADIADGTVPGADSGGADLEHTERYADSTTTSGAPGTPEDVAETDGTGDTAETADATVLDFRQRPSVTEADTEQATAEGLIDADEVGSEPLDLSEIQADDALLDALGGTNPSVPAESESSGPALESLLVAWRREVDAAPIGDLVELEEATAAVAAGRRPRHRSRRRHLVPVASAAAVLMIGFTGVGLAARDAMPGDMLWGVAQVLYTDHSSESTAAAAVRGELDAAEGALDEGRRSDAREALQRAEGKLHEVDAEHGHDELQSTYESLETRYRSLPDPSESSTSESYTSTHESTSVTTTPLPPPPPQQPPLPTPSAPPTTSTPSSSLAPTTSPTAPPSETTGSTDRPSGGTTGTSTEPGGGLFSPSN